MSLDIVQQIIAKEILAIQNIPVNDSILQAVETIHHHVHVKGGKLVVTGVGKGGEIGKNIATTFSSTGTPAVFLHPLEAVHGDLGLVQKNDVMLAMSNSGKTREVIELIPIAKNLIPDLSVVCMTGFDGSPITELADVVLTTGRPEEVCTLGLTPTTSTTVMTVLGDVLVNLMMRKINFTKEEYGKRHHGGYLGAKAQNKEYAVADKIAVPA